MFEDEKKKEIQSVKKDIEKLRQSGKKNSISYDSSKVFPPPGCEFAIAKEEGPNRLPYFSCQLPESEEEKMKRKLLRSQSSTIRNSVYGHDDLSKDPDYQKKRPHFLYFDFETWEKIKENAKAENMSIQEFIESRLIKNRMNE